MRQRWIAVLAAGFALAASGCASEGEEKEGVELISAYFDSNEVENDPFATESCCEDRRAQLAAMGGADRIIAGLLAAARCESADQCLDRPQQAAAREFGGSDAAVYERGILIEYADGSLEWMPLWVVLNGEGEAVLLDSDADTYDDLEEFQADNEFFESDDWILTAEDITETDGSEIVAVQGKTAPGWIPWAVGIGVAAAVLVIAAIVIGRVRYFRSLRRPEEPS